MNIKQMIQQLFVEDISLNWQCNFVYVNIFL